MQCFVSGIHWYQRVKEGEMRGKKTAKLQIELLNSSSCFMGRPLSSMYSYFALIYFCCLRCPAVRENQTWLRHNWLVL